MQVSSLPRYGNNNKGGVVLNLHLCPIIKNLLYITWGGLIQVGIYVGLKQYNKVFECSGTGVQGAAFPLSRYSTLFHNENNFAPRLLELHEERKAISTTGLYF